MRIIGHGRGLTVAGMTPAELGKALEKSLPSGYRGKIKLVSCHSGEDMPEVGSFGAGLATILAGSKKYGRRRSTASWGSVWRRRGASAQSSRTPTSRCTSPTSCARTAL